MKFMDIINRSRNVPIFHYLAGEDVIKWKLSTCEYCGAPTYFYDGAMFDCYLPMPVCSSECHRTAWDRLQYAKKKASKIVASVDVDSPRAKYSEHENYTEKQILNSVYGMCVR